MNFDEAPFFDVPFCRIEEAYLPTNNPWTIKPQSSSAAIVGTAANLVYQKIKTRQKYTNKLEKQLSLIQLNRENKDSDVITTSSVSIKQSYDLSCAGIADEILDAFSIFTPAMADDDSLANWDPMKISYEQKHFNSYKEQKYDDNPVEKHCPVKYLDGSEKISPTKSGEEGVRLYISNIPPSMTEEGLANLFSSIGTCYNVRKCKSINDTKTDFGFVSYRNVREAEAAIAKYNGFVFGDKYTLRVKLSVESNNNSRKKEKIIWGDSFLESGDRDNICKETSKSLATPSTNTVTNPYNTLLSPSSTVLTSKENPRLFIHGLKVGINENELQTIFKNIGQIYDVVIIPEKKQNQKITYGFVTLESVDAANKAIKMLHNMAYKGNKLTVSLSDNPKGHFGMKVNKNEDEIFYDNLYSSFSNDDKIDSATSLEGQQLESQNGGHNKTIKHETKNMNPSCSEAFHGLMLSELSTKPFPNANEFEVCFTEVVSPALMYAQVLDTSTIQGLQQVTQLLQELCENVDLPAFTPKVQEICCAKFSDDNLWYRASVLHYNADMTARVYFIDFGNKADVDSANIRCINKKLLEYPKLASTFSLEGIESSSEDGVWSNDAVKFLTFSLINQAIKVKCLRISDNTMICEVELPDGSHLSEKLIAKGFAVRRCKQTENNLENSLKVNLETLRDVNQNIPFHHYTEKDIVAYHPTSSNIDLLITHIENPSLFYGRIADVALNESIAKMSVDLLETFSKSFNSYNYEPEGGCICAGFHSEYGEWYRVLVLVVYKDRVVAFLIDFGDIVVMYFNDLRPLPQEFVSLPSQAIALRLFNIKPRTLLQSEENYLGTDAWNENVIETFKELVLFKKVSVEIVSEIDVAKEKVTDLSLTPAKTIFNVHLKLLDVDIGTALVSSSLACVKEEKAVNEETKEKFIQNSLEQISKRVMYKDLPEKELPGVSFSLLIVNTENPSLFHGQIPDIDLLQELDSMSQDMTLCYSEDFTEYIPVVGEVCAAYFLAFEQFFRARIDHISKSKVTVTSIDFGNTQTVTLADIKPLPMKYASIPSQAYHLSLYGIEPEGKNWSEECCKFFMEYCVYKKVGVTVREKLNQICYVDIFSDDVPSFSKLLIHNGYAICKIQVCESTSKCIELSQDTIDGIAKIDDSILKSKEFLDKRKIDPYTRLPLFDLPNRFDVLVCHVESLERFYSQVCDQESLKKVYELQLELNKYCQSCEISFYTPKDGELCCGYLDDAWYRVYVKNVSNVSANVFFIDYGNCCDLTFSMLRPFSDTFLTFPSLAVPMKVYNPNRIKSYVEVVEEFRNRTENKVCSVVVLNINDGLVEVEITDDSLVSIMSVLEKLDIEMNSEKNELLAEEIVAETSELLQDDQKDFEGVLDISSKPKLSSPKVFTSSDLHSESMVINEGLMKNRYEPIYKSATKNTFTVSSLPLHFHPLESVSCKMELSRLAISNKAVSILMTHVESPYLSYGVALNSLHIVDSFSEKISRLAEEYKDTFHLKAGELCCVRREDGIWFRGVTSSISDGEAVVFCLDHGFTLIVNHDCICPFFDELKIYAAQAIPIKLMLVKPINGELKWSEITLLKFKELIGGQNVKIIAKQHEGFVTSVKMRLSNSNQSVEQIMEDLGMAEVSRSGIEENLSSVFIKKESVPFSDIGKKIQLESLPKAEFMAIVTCSISPRLFYAQVFDEEKIFKVDEIGAKLEELYDSDEKDFEFHSGQLCAVKYHDKLWYRGYIISNFGNDNFVVYLIDYGYKENMQKKNIKPLPDALQQYPAQALCMQLNNLVPVGLSGTYSHEANSTFKMLSEFRLVRVRPVLSIGNLHRVVIFDDITNNNIGAQMVQLGFAEYISIVQEHYSEKKQFTNGTLRDIRHKAISHAISASYKTKQKHF